MSTNEERIREAALRLFAQKGSAAITVSELAEEAGIARGTVYDNVEAPDALFDEIAASLATEMHERLATILPTLDDPAERLATGIRCFVRRAHEEPNWGRFLVRFSFSNHFLQTMWNAAPMADLVLGLSKHRYDFAPEHIASVVALITGTTLAAMFSMLSGYKNWQDAGSEAAQLVLRSLGVTPADARRMSTKKLPLLPSAAEATNGRKRRRGE